MHEWPLIVLTIDSSGSVAHAGQAAAVCGNRVDGTSHSDPYCEWNWDGASLFARTDRYGFFPLFYYQWDRGIMLSPSILALLNAGAPSELDDGSVAVLLRRWMCVGADTPFERIRTFAGGGTLIWKPGERVRIESSLRIGKSQTLSRSAAVDGYIDRFREAIRRRAAVGMSIVPLSGGRDSRHIFLELCASGRQPDMAVTVGRVGRQLTSNAEIASAVARRANVSHVTLDLPISRWRAQRETSRAMHFSALESWWLRAFVSYLDRLSERPTVYEGVGGDILSTGLYKPESLRRLYDRGEFATIAETLLGPERYFEQLLSPEFYRRFRRELAVDRIVTELARHSAAPNPLASFFFYNRARRVTALAPSSLMGQHAMVWCPYLDADVFEHLSSLPPEFLEGDSISAFHDAAIRRAYPDFADIPYGSKWGGERRYDLRTIVEMSAAVAKNPPRMIRKSFLLPRLARGVVDPTFTRHAAELAPYVCFFMELDAQTRRSQEAVRR